MEEMVKDLLTGLFVIIRMFEAKEKEANAQADWRQMVDPTDQDGRCRFVNRAGCFSEAIRDVRPIYERLKKRYENVKKEASDE